MIMAAKNKISYTIDKLIPSDWQQICTIYLEGIATKLATFETKPPTWKQWNVDHLSTCRLVARSGSKVIGWAALSAVSQRKCYAGVAEISLYISTAYRRQGVGKALMKALITESKCHGIWTLQGSTFPENMDSLCLQKAFGFRIVGYRKRIACHYGIWRDTVIMERRSNTINK